MSDVVLPPDTGLPVEGSIDEVRAALATAGVAVLSAEPGAGKTTIVPLRLLADPDLRGTTVMLEPRRVAARAAARRMSALVGDDVGGIVGYRTRDERRVSARTQIEVVTEAMLTRRLQADPEVAGTGLVIFDEFHERNLHADLGLALALDVRRSLRPDLRILVMSATLDVKRIAAHLGDAPVITSPGRTHPVDVRWVPRSKNDRLERATAAAVARALRDESGDVLVFLPGAAEIRRTADALIADGLTDDVDVRPLYGALPAAEQDAALAPSADPSRRKVVIATDIAETSLTVEGVHVVVDAGLARVPRFDAGTGMTRLTTLSASKASAEQRAGRAGRLGPGVVYRLWSKIEHAARRPHIDPEISQVDLAGLVLELGAWGVTDASALPFLDPPPRRALDEGRALLESLGAVDADGRVTADGRRMVSLPLHPRLARMVVTSIDRQDGWLACLLAALLEARDVLRGRADERPADIDLRLRLLADPTLRYPEADGRALASVRNDAHDIARRAGIEPGGVRFEHAGRVLAAAYPDRLAQNRGGSTPGRFKLRNGHGAFVAPTDVLAREPFVVAADLDGQRRDARLRLGAPMAHDDVLALFASDLTQHVSIGWDAAREDVVARAERKLGQLNLGTIDLPVEPGPAVERVLREQLSRGNLSLLRWTPDAERLRARLAFLHRHRATDGWPDVSKRALLDAIDLSTATSRRDVEALDVGRLLRGLVPPTRHGDLERLAPEHIGLPNGRTAPIDYSGEAPHVAVIVQDAFGLTTTPTVLDGEMRLVVQLLSPARRPVQVTSDLEGFWAGSWHEVRKEMAGRYPKHAWPEDPTRNAGRTGA